MLTPLQRMNVTVPGLCLHLPASPSHPHGRLRARNEYDAEHIKKMQREARAKNHWPSDRVGYPQNDTRCVIATHYHTLLITFAPGLFRKQTERALGVLELPRYC